MKTRVQFRKNDTVERERERTKNGWSLLRVHVLIKIGQSTSKFNDYVFVSVHLYFFCIRY